MERKREECKENFPDNPCDCKEVLTYGFFLRFAKESYIPCPKCQGRLHELLMQNNWDISATVSVGFYYSPSLSREVIKFRMFFLPEGLMEKYWTPCDNCQKYLLNIVRKSELILGHKEYTNPPVELWRKWLPKK